MNFELNIFLIAVALFTAIFIVAELKYWFNAKKDEKTMDMKKNE